MDDFGTFLTYHINCINNQSDSMPEETSASDKWANEISPLLEQLRSSSTNTLNVSLFKLNSVIENEAEKLDNSQKDLILFVILSTYTRYPYDTKFNRLVLQSFKHFVANDTEKYSKNILGFIAKQSAKPVAARDLLTLISWNSAVTTMVSDKKLISSLLKVSVPVSVKLISLLLDYNQIDVVKVHQLRKVSSFKDDVVSSIRTVAKVDSGIISTILDSICDEKLPMSGVISMLGLLASATSKPNMGPELKELQSKEDSICNFFAKTCLSTKTYPATKSLEIFGTFVNNIITSDSLEKVILPGLEKAALRNSELTFAIFSPHIFRFLNYDSIDAISIVLKSKFFGQLFSSLKSSKETVRLGSSEILRTVLNNNKLNANDDVITPFLDESFKILKALPSSAVEQKVLVVNVINSVQYSFHSSTEKILDLTLPYVAKENNESYLPHLLDTMLSRFVHLICEKRTFDSKSKIVELLNSGLKEKKIPLKTAWCTSFGASILKQNITSENENEIFELFNSGITDSLLKVFNECVDSPLPSIHNKLIAGGYASIAVLFNLSEVFGNEELDNKLKESKIVERSLEETETKLSCFINPKILTKLNTEESQEWFVRSLFSLSRHLVEPSALLGSAYIYTTLSRNVLHRVRLLSRTLLHKFYALKQNVVGSSLTSAVNELMKESTLNTELNYDFHYLLPAVSSTLYPLETNDPQLLESQLVDLLIPFEHAMLNSSSNGWVSLCQKCNVDPGRIVKEHAEEIVDRISAILADQSDEVFNNGTFEAARKTASIISFFSPESTVPLLSEQIQRDLSIVPKLEIDSTKLEIWKGRDGELVIDILASKAPVNIAKSKDSETLKWEQSVRKELEDKKKSVKKFTKEEQVKVKEQLELEKIIRQSVNSQYLKLRRGLELIVSLSKQAKSVDNASGVWFPIAISNILTLLNSKAAISLVGKLASDCFLILSEVVSNESLTGTSSMKFVGASTLRLHAIEDLAAEYKGKPLDEMLASQLFSLKLCSDKSLFNNLTLMYVLPLLVRIIENGKNYVKRIGDKSVKVNTEFSEEAPEEELLVMALEIISSNSDLFEDATIPRTVIIEHLIELLALPSKAKAAKECFVSLCQNISLNISDSDLNIILKSLISPIVFVRAAILEVLDQEFDLSKLDFNEELWISCFDNIETNKEVAEAIWSESEFSLKESCVEKLVPYLGAKDNGIRLSIAKSIASAITQLKSDRLFSSSLTGLIDLYRVMSKPPELETDEFGLVVKSNANQKDRWEQRSGVALTVTYLAPMFTKSEEVSKFFTFLIKERSLGDKEGLVRSELQEAGLKIIERNGKGNVEILITIFEECLAEKDEKSKVQDMVKESVIIMYGSLARHLDKDDSRIDAIVNRLLESLDTPSEDVQYAVSECISPLVPFIQTKMSSYIDNFFDKLFGAKSLAVRRGAAYGIAGLAKGIGIKALCEYDVIRNLTEASDDKKDNQKRESVLFAFECISQAFGPLFEPYVVEILPIVLKSFGDSSAEVREATDYASRVIMKNTTSYGIKKMIPLAISNLDDMAWRTKKGSVELLGSMAYLDPAQLSSSLPNIVPNIVSVLNDTHKEVRKAADAALKKFGEVIRNPEIQELVPILLKAIGDPTKYTDEALDSLISTQFVHYIDGPSLALIIHVIDRGMQDRSANTKKKACQIVGNMAILVDTNDLMPYLSRLVSELNDAVVDPVPQTRATAARALGSLVEKLGEDKFPGLMSSLLAALQDEEKPGNRLGSAQALAEIISGLGISKLEEMLPVIIAGTTSSKSFVREGFMPLLLFLPVSYGSQFAPYLSKTIPPILAGLADTLEEIRDVSLRAGRLIVNNYAKKAVDLLLPELEKGLSDSNARIRLSSVELTGELLFKISGISGKQELADDVTLSKNVAKAFNDVLGNERRNNILSSLFVCRSDTSGAVRATAANIWKALVANTPKTIKEIMPTLVVIIVRRLASPDDTQRIIVAATLGDMIRRVGGNALSQILPTLQETMVSSDSDAKQGICIALYEIINSTNSDNIIQHQDIFVSIVKEALVDPNPSVREAAAQAFDSLQESIGNSAVDEVIPQLLEMLNSSDGSEDALSALQEIMSTKSDVIFPILIPSLLTPPINGRAIGALAQAAGNALYRRLSTILNALVDGISNGLGDKEELYSALITTLLSINSDEGCHPLLQHILSLMKHEDIKKKNIIFDVLPAFFKETTLDYSIYTEDIVVQCIYLLNDENEELAKKAFETLTILVKRQTKESLEKLVYPAQQTLSYIPSGTKDIYAFTLPRGPSCVLPIFLHGLMYGNPQQREISANGISIIIDHTPAAGLKPFVTLIVGPLIRVIGERFSSDVKSAILLALNKLFSKIPQFLYPFIPQLQRTFIKSLSDPSSEVLRTRAAKALGTLIKYQPKVDPLVAELLNNAKAIDSGNISLKTAILKALLEVVDKAGSKMSEASKNGVMALVEQDMFSDGAGVNAAVAYAKLVGALSKILNKSELNNMLRNKIFSCDLEDDNSSRFAILTLNAFLKDSAESVLNSGLFPEICEFIISSSNSTKAYVSDNSTIAIGKVLLSLEKLEEVENSLVSDLVKQLCILMDKPNSSSSDTRRLSLVVARTISRYQYDTTVKPYLSYLIPSVFACVRDPIIPVKLAAEKAILAILHLVEDDPSAALNGWVESLGGSQTVKTVSGTVLQLRSITEYVKRVGTRLANVERERISAGGDKETMFSDQYEDETEIWAIGGVDLSEE